MLTVALFRNFEVNIMQVLAIGNSFSQDATTYLHQIAKTAGTNLTVVNLYIPACPLDRHYRNMLSDARDYDLHFNGQITGFKISLEEALLSREWDVITLQQQSVRSAQRDSFEPYLTALYDYVKECAPKAKVYLHQTWALESGSERIAKAGFDSYDAMFSQIEANYAYAYDLLKNDGIIPSGRLLAELLRQGVPTVHRDGLHVTRGLGRYALGLLWYRFLTGNSVADNSFADFDEPIGEAEICLAKNLVEKLVPAR